MIVTGLEGRVAQTINTQPWLSLTEGRLSTSGGSNDITQITDDHDHLELKTVQDMDHNLLDLENDIDPENNFFSNINDKCGYYTDELHNQTILTDNKWSIIHFNGRSLYANFSNIKDHSSQFTNPFKIIAVSETWIKADKGMDFELNGYELNFINRKNKSGGGVAMYVDKNWIIRW